MKNSLEEVLNYRKYRYEQSVSIVEQKGKEYSGKKQDEGDSLFNYRIHFLLGWSDSEDKYPLFRVLEKLQRLQSIITQKDTSVAKVEEEIDDIHNIIDYVGLMFRTKKNDEMIEEGRRDNISSGVYKEPLITMDEPLK